MGCEGARSEPDGSTAERWRSRRPQPTETNFSKKFQFLRASFSGFFRLQVGDRVIVSGTKIGILRFSGTTEFAQGEWAGVELEQPIGKNDGSVQGKRYEENTVG